MSARGTGYAHQRSHQLWRQVKLLNSLSLHVHHMRAGGCTHILLEVSPGCGCFSPVRSDLHEKPRVPITALCELTETEHQGPAKSKLYGKRSLSSLLPPATPSLLYAIKEVSFKVFQLTIFPGSPIHRGNPSPAMSVIFSLPTIEMIFQNVAFKLFRPAFKLCILAVQRYNQLYFSYV